MGLRRVVGRDGELARLERFVTSVGSGAPARALVLSGDAGIGKTTLWRATVDAAREAAVRVLTARPVEAEAKLSFAAIGDVLDPVLDDLLPGLPSPQRRAVEAALLLDEGGPAIDPRTTAVAVLTGVRTLARRGPLIVAVDDVQWLDGASEAVLRFVARRLGDEPVGLLVSERVDAPGPMPLGLDTALPEGRVGRVVVEGLTLDALHQLLQDRFGEALPRPVLGRLHEATQGNPYFALEIADELRRSSIPIAPGEPLPLPGSLEELLRARIATLPAATRDALLAVASLSEPTQGLVQAATGERTWAARLGPALDAGVVEVDGERIRFTHPLLAACVYRTAPQERRRAMHARLGRLAPTPEERARHLALGAGGPDPAVAAELDAAAERAAQRGAPAVAAGLYELAAAATPPDDVARRQERLTTAAEQFRDGGMHVRARDLLEPLLPELPPGRLRARALFVLGWTATSWADCDARSRQALEEAGDDDDLRLRIHHWLGYVWIVRGDGQRAREHADRAVEIAERRGDPVSMCRALGLRMVVGLLICEPMTEADFDRGRAFEDGAREVSTFYTPSLVRATRLLYRDRLDEARREFRAGLEIVADRGDEEMVSVVTYHLGQVEWRAGRWDRADRHAAEGYELMAALDSPVRQAQFRCLQGTLAAHRGDIEEARRLLGEAEAMTSLTGDVLYAIESATWLGFLELSLGDHESACALLVPIPERLADMGSREPFHYHALPNLVEALVSLGRVEEATAAADLLSELAGAADAPLALAQAARCRSLIAAAQGDLDGALAALDEALAHHARAPVPFEHARTLLVLGSTLRRRRKQAKARDALSRAHAEFERLGARLWADRARAEMARIGGRRAGGAVLTASERELAALVAQGRSNREAAAALFVTPKTVETKLSRIYTKLGIRSRTQLARWVAEQAEDGDAPATKL